MSDQMNPISTEMSRLGKKSWEARAAKMLAKKRANKALFASQTVSVDDHWKIIRVDEYSWKITKDGKFRGFYGKITEALNALNGKMLDDEAKGSLNDLLGLQKRLYDYLSDKFKGWTPEK